MVHTRVLREEVWVYSNEERQAFGPLLLEKVAELASVPISSLSKPSSSCACEDGRRMPAAYASFTILFVLNEVDEDTLVEDLTDAVVDGTLQASFGEDGVALINADTVTSIRLKTLAPTPSPTGSPTLSPSWSPF